MTELGNAGGVGIQERYPLTPLQHGMLLRTLLAPAQGVNVPYFAGSCNGWSDIAQGRTMAAGGRPRPSVPAGAGR